MRTIEMYGAQYYVQQVSPAATHGVAAVSAIFHEKLL